RVEPARDRAQRVVDGVHLEAKHHDLADRSDYRATDALERPLAGLLHLAEDLASDTTKPAQRNTSDTHADTEDPAEYRGEFAERVLDVREQEVTEPGQRSFAESHCETYRLLHHLAESSPRSSPADHVEQPVEQCPAQDLSALQELGFGDDRQPDAE